MKVVLSVVFGLIVFSGLSQEFKLIKNQDQLLSRSINCIDAGDYALWIGSDKGINRVEVIGNTISEVTARQTTKPVLSLCNDGKFLWVGISEKGLYLFNKTTYTFVGKFKQKLGTANLELIRKEGDKLIIGTKNQGSYFVNLTDTSLHSNGASLAKVKVNVIFNKAVFKGSDNGILIQSSSVSNQIAESKVLLDSLDTLNVSDSIVGLEYGLSNAVGQENSEMDSVAKIDLEEGQKQAAEVNESKISSFDSKFLWILFPVIFLYSLVLVKIVARRYKRDIRILEEELLKTKK